ncbi:hypothetical protein L484_014965 [Morus notabilis]|uniref:Uncharacterized protein n=1 Tax=Morus notabilis TaxID=981085 RepID=W9SKL7_9ROSA|nr:hypothetical protein L484_014965 [Morus notabilis]
MIKVLEDSSGITRGVKLKLAALGLGKYLWPNWPWNCISCGERGHDNGVAGSKPKEECVTVCGAEFGEVVDLGDRDGL